MKRFLVLFLLGVAFLRAQSETIDLGAHGKLTMYFPGEWRVDVADYGDRKMVSVKPAGDANAECALTITFPPEDKFERKDKLKMRVEVDAEPYAQQSKEGRAYAKPFALQTGFGFHCDFTDPELVGKPSQKGNFKTISVGLIRLAPDVLIEVSISADGFSSEPYQQLLGALEGMEFKPAA